MKKTLIVVFTLLTVGAFAQRTNVESAVIYLRNLEMEDAKKAIDAAAEHADTKDDPKMWSVRAAVYDTIIQNPEFNKLDSQMAEKFVVSCLKCLETDTKKRYEDYCKFAVINGGFATYNKAIEYYSAGDAANALKFFQYVIQVFPYDEKGHLRKNNINEKQITLNMASLAIKNKDKKDAKIYLQRLIDWDYQDPLIYALMAEIYYEDGDTTTGLSITDKGRKRFPSDKQLINQELNIYMAQGKQNVLLDKLNEALTIDDENTTLLYVRGTVYGKFSVNAQRDAKAATDTIPKLKKKAANEGTPAGKAKYEAAAKRYLRMADSLNVQSANLDQLAEKDYKRAVELKEDYLDVYYNLGAMYNNRANVWTEKINNIDAKTQDEYDRRYNVFKKVQDSILTISKTYFDKCLELAESLPESDDQSAAIKNAWMVDIYFGFKAIYVGFGDEKKAREMMKMMKEYESRLGIR